jgi:predicted Zn-dependent peptidase
MAMRRTRTLLPLAVLVLLTAARVLAEGLPGGEVEVRAALTTEKGSHPRIVVQTVPDATTTATCLVIRYAEANSVRPPAGAPHLLEHILFRTRPGGEPGSLLVRNERLGDSSKAWVTPTTIVFSELVPSNEGLESLKLQLARLKSVPEDKEGLILEKRVLMKEIEAASSPEETARRKILQSYGFEPNSEGTVTTLTSLDSKALQSVLSELNLKEDVVIAVVGPHTPREVRTTLSSCLTTLAPARTSARESSLAPGQSPGAITASSDHGQRSYFFQVNQFDPRVLRVAHKLAQLMLGQPTAVRLEREEGNLLRLDLATGLSTDNLLGDLTPQQSNQLYNSLSRDWLDTFESQQARAEMLALAELQGFAPEFPISESEFPALVEEAKALLEQGLKTETTLTLTGGSTDKLYSYRTRAFKTLPVRKEKLPNGMGVTIQSLDSFPIVAVSGFFRVSPPLDIQQMSVLENALSERLMTYEVKPTGILFHHWASAGTAEETLTACARELKELAQVKDFQTSSEPKLDLIDQFFIAPTGNGTSKRLKGSKLFQPESAHLVVVGPVTRTTLDKGLRPAWSGWFSESPAPGFSKPSPESPQDLPEQKTVATPPGSSPALILGFIGPARSSPDFLPFNLAIQTLGGRPNTSVLARKLTNVTSVKVFPLPASERVRDDSSEQVWLLAVRASRPWNDPEGAVRKIEGMLKNLGAKSLAKPELDRTRDFLKSSLTLSASTVRGRARVLAHAEFYRLSESYADDFAGLYDHLSPELVMTVCGNYLNKPQVRWLYFEPGKESDATNSSQ